MLGQCLSLAFPRRLTDLRFCSAANVVTASEAREPDGYRDCSNRLLGGRPLVKAVHHERKDNREFLTHGHLG